MRIQGLDLRILDAPEITDTTLDACWRLRARFMRLKPAVTPEGDRAAFGAWLRRAGCLLAVARDARGDVQIFFDMNAEPLALGGAAHLALFENFVFVAQEHRRHPALMLGTLTLMLSQLRRHGIHRRAHWLIGVYPRAFILSARIATRMWILGEAGVPEAVDGLGEHMARHLYGDAWHPDRRLIEARTLPQDFQPRGAEAEALYARYVARNPEWRAGYNVLALAPVDPRGLASLLGAVARRALRR